MRAFTRAEGRVADGGAAVQAPPFQTQCSSRRVPDCARPPKRRTPPQLLPNQERAAPARADGPVEERSAQVLPFHSQVSPSFTVPLSPPKRTTTPRTGSKAMAAS